MCNLDETQASICHKSGTYLQPNSDMLACLIRTCLARLLPAYDLLSVLSALSL